MMHNRISQKKGEIYESNSKAYRGSLSRDIETLDQVLIWILTLKNERIHTTTQPALVNQRSESNCPSSSIK